MNADTLLASTEPAESILETPVPRASALAHVEVTPSAGTSRTSAHADPREDGQEVGTNPHY